MRDRKASQTKLSIATSFFFHLTFSLAFAPSSFHRFGKVAAINFANKPLSGFNVNKPISTDANEGD
jgi:hypothetical protein